MSQALLQRRHHGLRAVLHVHAPSSARRFGYWPTFRVMGRRLLTPRSDLEGFEPGLRASMRPRANPRALYPRPSHAPRHGTV